MAAAMKTEELTSPGTTYSRPFDKLDFETWSGVGLEVGTEDGSIEFVWGEPTERRLLLICYWCRNLKLIRKLWLIFSLLQG